MIFTRSPYYVKIDSTAPPEFINGWVRIWVWRGTPADRPILENYEVTSKLIDNKMSVNVSNFINDYMGEFQPIQIGLSGVYYNNDTVNVHFMKLVTKAGNTNSIAFDGETNLASYGYTYYEEGENYNFDDADKGRLMDGDYLKTTGNLIIPFETYDLLDYSVKSYPSNTLLVSGNIDSESDSKAKYQYIILNKNVVPATDTHILVDIGGFINTFIIERECKHTPYYVQFKNRYGVNQLLTFFKKSTTNLDVSKDEFQKKSYVRQIYNYNVNAKKTYTLTTGYQHESINEPIEQLMLSEHVWISTDATQWIPVNVDTKSLDYKTKINDKLISYQLSFEQAFNTINNV